MTKEESLIKNPYNDIDYQDVHLSYSKVKEKFNNLLPTYEDAMGGLQNLNHFMFSSEKITSKLLKSLNKIKKK